ncbi:hypothetical protein H5410_030125 [Solanum commersonii]|uniref:Uncharacterized protein n=1 Tax=Solanum commersonii TaxID=4109 RepID=A0A9J5YDD4_SOLCO|nr:hypothetical protein H5410_030125 [Solanum commersonii]
MGRAQAMISAPRHTDNVRAPLLVRLAWARPRPTPQLGASVVPLARVQAEARDGYVATPHSALDAKVDR